jgi:hypothetical protein
MFIVAAGAKVRNQDGHMVQCDRSGLAGAAKGAGIVQRSQMLEDLRYGLWMPLECELLLKCWHQLSICWWEHFGQLVHLIEDVDVRAMSVHESVGLLAHCPLLLGLLQCFGFQWSSQLLLQMPSTYNVLVA